MDPFRLVYCDSAHTSIPTAKQGGHIVGTHFAACLIATSAQITNVGLTKRIQDVSKATSNTFTTSTFSQLDSPSSGGLGDGMPVSRLGGPRFESHRDPTLPNFLFNSIIGVFYLSQLPFCAPSVCRKSRIFLPAKFNNALTLICRPCLPGDCMDEEWAAGDMGPEVLTSQLQHADIVIGSSRDDGKVFLNTFLFCQCPSNLSNPFFPHFIFHS